MPISDHCHCQCLTCIEVILFQQGTNELQVGMDVLVDVRGPLVTLMEPTEELHR